MRAAITIWEERVSPVFDVSREALLVDVIDQQIVGTEQLQITPRSPLDKIEWLVRREVKTLICGAISESLFLELEFYKLKVHGFITGPVEDVLSAYLADTLQHERFLMPGCSVLGRRRHGRSHGFGGEGLK